MMISKDVLKTAQYWATSSDFDNETNAEIQNLIDKKEYQEITERFYRDLEFGTGGIRGVVGAGTFRMNIFNIRKATQALGRYLLEANDSKKDVLRVAVTYDSRLYSEEFAKASCQTLAAMGFKVLMTERLRPVPFLSFLVREKSCHAGICITASHNPPSYNGFKVYWSDGAQLVPPHDHKLIAHYGRISSYSIAQVSFEEAVKDGQIEMVTDDMDERYIKALEQQSLHSGRAKKSMKIVYSPLHGSGATLVPRVMRAFGFAHTYLVEEQKEPDGRFPTVETPNPEDPKALKAGVDFATKISADLVLANDPDADRVGVAVREGEKWNYLNGNEIGCLLYEYILSWKSKCGQMPENPLVVKTIVTTDLQRKIAEHYGVHCDDTLTGFKWICNLVREYEVGQRKPKRNFVCGGEESYGFLAGTSIRDKDGVMSSALFAEMAAYYRDQGKMLSEVLNGIYLRHGYFCERLYTIAAPGKDGKEKIRKVMASFRSNMPKKLAGSSVVEYRDIQAQEVYQMHDGEFLKSEATGLPQSNVLQLYLADSVKISIRPSGTEPKIKVYVSAWSSIPKNLDDLESIKMDVQEMARSSEASFIEMVEASFGDS